MCLGVAHIFSKLSNQIAFSKAIRVLNLLIPRASKNWKLVKASKLSSTCRPLYAPKFSSLWALIFLFLFSSKNCFWNTDSRWKYERPSWKCPRMIVISGPLWANSCLLRYQQLQYWRLNKKQPKSWVTFGNKVFRELFERGFVVVFFSLCDTMALVEVMVATLIICVLMSLFQCQEKIPFGSIFIVLFSLGMSLMTFSILAIFTYNAVSFTTTTRDEVSL